MADPREFNMQEPYQEQLRGGEQEPPTSPNATPGAQPYPPGIQTLWPCSTAETGCLYELRQRTMVGLCLGRDHWLGHTQQVGLCPWNERCSLPEVGVRLPITPKQKPGVNTLFFALRDVEHLSGPGCRYPGAYHGHRISMQEMKGCDTVQALIPGSGDRAGHWPPPYHLPFERDGDGEGRFVLSGLADSLGSRSDVIQVYPERYDIRVIHVANQFVDPPSPAEAEVLFHPWCFGVFRQLCRSKLGYLPLDKFYSFFHNLEPSPPSVLLSIFPYEYRQWIHYPGDEWLVTNPFGVDQLRKIFNNAMDPECDQSSGIPGPARGPFPNLPMEIRTMIFSYLTYHDVHALRLVCREFSHLPPHIWFSVL
ncbi:hypothetical protein ASPVEDRAFT_89784 [Aspergillus versicolor CBS 583.65]|uniref:F-box domain-containing protein n=1 Tax=Aspergillus versicolor CBS 583.65 TaxID=1036611 RepID=A0A1L9Q467_ASPVE|nr:uncharacterized protein ASPVEDRAFT_89784 [Aspergillus versicolor CBS 583.65]OJJ08573.1 hypothetical protein ASPVEDRAFT_89784 [Aspergillus versicolor CBS 583.65]